MELSNFRSNRTNNRAFTLIELLVVVLVIGILSTILVRIIDIRGIQAKARDAQRVKGLKSIQSTLELYFSDNREYPATLDNLRPEYVNALPKDPKRNDPYNYDSSVTYFTPAGSGFILVAIMEVPSSADGSRCTLPIASQVGLPDNSNCYMLTSPTSPVVPVQ